MTQCNFLNIKLSNSQLNELKSVTNNDIQVTINFASNVISDASWWD